MRGWLLIILFTFQLELLSSQSLDFVSSIPNYELSIGDIEIDNNQIIYIGEIVDTLGHRGYMLANFSLDEQLFTCQKYFMDSVRSKQLIFSPIVKVSDDRFLALGPAWNPSRVYSVMLDNVCDTLSTREYKIGHTDTLAFLLIHEIIKTSDGGFACVGTIGFNEPQDSNGTQVLLTKFDESLEISWQTDLGNYRNQYGFDILETTNHNLHIFGLDRKDNDPAFDSIVRPLIYYEFDLEGVNLKTIYHEKEIRSHYFQMVETPDGGFISCSSKMIDKYYNNSIPGNIYSMNSIFKVDTNFNYIWENHYGHKLSTKNNGYFDLVKSYEGDGVVVCGSVADSADGKIIHYGVVTKIGWDGDSIWTRRYLPNNSPIPVSPDCAFTKIITTEYGYFVAGVIELDTPRIEYLSTQQLWFMHLNPEGCLLNDCTTDFIEPEGAFSRSGQILYVNPNPADNQVVLMINPRYRSVENIQIFNCIGNRVFSDIDIMSNGYYSFNVEDLTEGLYFIVLSENGRVIESKKLLIIHP